jgi:hypothetical protein
MKSVAHVARLTNFTMIRQFFLSSSDITWPNFTNARCTQASQDILQAYYYSTGTLQQEFHSLQEIHLVKLFIQLQVAKRP